METPSHQEWRARQRVNWRAIWQTALCVGGVLFLMSGGSPWTTAGTMNAAMGRDLPLGFYTLLVLHMAMAYVYVVIMAFAIFRLRLGASLFVGVGVGVVLYALNYAFFYSLSVQMQSPEIRALLVHLSFGLFAAAIYKGASVPKPFSGGTAEVASATDHWLHGHRHSEDPEPAPAAA